MRLFPSNPARIAGPLTVALAALLSPTAARAGHGAPLPEVIDLPAGFQPEGITTGRGNVLYVAAINNGAVFKLNPRTGAGSFLVDPRPGGSSVGIKFDRRTNLLYVAGGASGHGFVYDAGSGAQLADIPLSTGGASFVNDVLITDRTVYFTESFKAVFYAVPLRRGGRLPASPTAREIALSGDYQNVDGQFNANGIELAPDGEDLLIINSFVGVLYRVDRRTGVADAVDLGGGSLVNGDGLVLRDRLLYVVENFSNAIAVVKLSRHADRGRIVDTITHPRFDIPATAAFLKGALYVTNARFTTPATPTTPYWLVRVPITD